MIEKISVIIPLYNKEREIKRTIDSVLKQTIQNFEIIVVDDNSSDGGPAIVRNYRDPRISFIEQDHRGVSYTRNHGVSLAKSNLIAFLDADDEWMPKHLEIILRLVEKYPDAGMYTTAHKEQTKDGKTQWPDYKYIPNPPWEGLLPDYFKSGALGSYPVNASTVVIPGKIFDEMGGFTEGCWYGEDADLFGKIALKYQVAFSWELGAIYHFDAENRACDRGYPQDFEEPFVKTARNALLRGDVPPKFIESLNEYIAKKEIYRAFCNIHDGNSKNAKIILERCNTQWHSDEKKRLMLLAKIPSPLFLFMRDMRRNFINAVRKKYPTFRKSQETQEKI